MVIQFNSVLTWVIIIQILQSFDLIQHHVNKNLKEFLIEINVENAATCEIESIYY